MNTAHTLETRGFTRYAPSRGPRSGTDKLRVSIKVRVSLSKSLHLALGSPDRVLVFVNGNEVAIAPATIEDHGSLAIIDRGVITSSALPRVLRAQGWSGHYPAEVSDGIAYIRK